MVLLASAPLTMPNPLMKEDLPSDKWLGVAKPPDIIFEVQPEKPRHGQSPALSNGWKGTAAWVGHWNIRSVRATYST